MVVKRQAEYTANHGVLAIWCDLTGETLDAKGQSDFLAKVEVTRLAGYRVAEIVAAGRAVRSPGKLKVDEWLDAVERGQRQTRIRARSSQGVGIPKHKAAESGSQSGAPERNQASRSESSPTPQRSRGRTQPRGEEPTRLAPLRPTRDTRTLRSPDGRFPQRPVDTDLAKKIGPIQNYEDNV